MVIVLCVCVCVTMLTATYLVFYIEIQVSLGFLCRFQRMPCVDLVENALLKSPGDINFADHPPSSLLDQLSVDK